MVISGVISPLIWLISIVTLTITPFITTHEPASKPWVLPLGPQLKALRDHRRFRTLKLAPECQIYASLNPKTLNPKTLTPTKPPNLNT